MDFDGAVEAHKAWKGRLFVYIGNPDGSFTHSTVTDDTACELGKWIYGGATAAYRQEAEFVELKIAHAQFHLEAAKVIWKVNHGEETSEEMLVGSRSTYAIASDEVISRILRMKERFPAGTP